MLHRARVLSSGIHLPLQKLALCLDCDECFELGESTCPACGSNTWTPLGRFLGIGPATVGHHPINGPRRLTARRAAEDLATAKQLLVVARQRRELYEEIKRVYAGQESVLVILDRRVNARREKKNAPMLDRRRNERRARSAVDEQLRTIGWSLALLDPTRARRN